jgi:hypothetical protein
MFNALKRSISRGMYRQPWSPLGIQSGAVADNTTYGTITLSRKSDAVNFEVGMSIVAVAAADPPTGAPATAVSVVGVDRDAGTINVSSNTATGFDTTDILIAEGDYATSTATRGITGLETWLPAYASGSTTTPTPAAIGGVTRTSDVQRLAGQRVQGESLGLDETVKKLAAIIGEAGGSPDTCFMSYRNVDLLTNILGNSVQRIEQKVGEVGFGGVQIYGPDGIIKVYPDMNCPGDRVYILQLDTWTLASLGEAPMILDYDGNKGLRESADDALEIRAGFYGNLTCKAPGWNGVATVTAP